MINHTLSKTEETIISAANKVFLTHGIQSTTMGQIAKEAGMCRTSLNYYFRSKKRLITHVIQGLRGKLAPSMTNLIGNNELTVIEKIEHFIDEYLTLVNKYPMVPAFMLSELSRDPDWVLKFIKESPVDYSKFRDQVNLEISRGLLPQISLEEMLVNILGLCLFPVLTKPVLHEFFFNNNDKALAAFLEGRKTQVKKIIRCWLEQTEVTLSSNNN